MTKLKSRIAFTKVLGVLLLASVATSCNDSESSKAAAEQPADTTVVTPPVTTPDTMHMDTATTRPPVKSPN